MALSDDSRILAELVMHQGGFREPTASLKILDAMSGRVLAEHGGWSPNARLAVSPDGRRLAVADNAQLKVWTLPAIDGQPFRLPEPTTIHPSSTEVRFTRAVFSLDPEGRQIATVHGRMVSLWNTATGACEGRIDAQSEVSSVAYVPGGAHIVTGDVFGRVRFWSIGPALLSSCADDARPERTVPLMTLHEHRAPINAITFVADGSRFATASDDYTAEVWDTKTGRHLLTFRHMNPVTHAAFSSDGTRLMTMADIQGVRVWEVPLKAELLSKARSRITRPCLTKEERERFFPGTSVDDPPCVAVLR
jgi:WD40 repeat protein